MCGCNSIGKVMHTISSYDYITTDVPNLVSWPLRLFIAKPFLIVNNVSLNTLYVCPCVILNSNILMIKIAIHLLDSKCLKLFNLCN